VDQAQSLRSQTHPSSTHPSPEIMWIHATIRKGDGCAETILAARRYPIS
jgi:hypothetical protein